MTKSRKYYSEPNPRSREGFVGVMLTPHYVAGVAVWIANGAHFLGDMDDYGWTGYEIGEDLYNAFVAEWK